MAFFEATGDLMLLHRAAAEIAPRAKRMVAGFIRQGGEDAIPPPADLRPAREPAPEAEALRTLRAIDDFALLQVVARSIGRRIEALEIVASAEFPVGSRVRVPEKVAFPPAGRKIEGTVESTGTHLQVLLDNGETWHGPPSLAERPG
jgi:hypothetical protein